MNNNNPDLTQAKTAPWDLLSIFSLLALLALQVWGLGQLGIALEARIPSPITKFLNTSEVVSSLACLLSLYGVHLIAKTAYGINLEKELCPLWKSNLFFLGILLGSFLAAALLIIQLQIDEKWETYQFFYQDERVLYLFSKLFSSAFIIPFVEEVLFRGLLYAWLRRQINIPLSVLVSAALFALIHTWGPRALYAFILGIILTVAFEKARTLSFPYIIHASYNFCVILITYYFQSVGR